MPFIGRPGVINKQRSGVTGAESRRADCKWVLLWRRVGVTPLMTERVIVRLLETLVMLEV